MAESLSARASESPSRLVRHSLTFSRNALWTTGARA